MMKIKNVFILINIPLLYYFHIYLVFTYFVFYIFVKYDKTHQNILHLDRTIQNEINQNENNQNENKDEFKEQNKRDINALIKSDDIDTRFFIGLIYIITIYYGYIFIYEVAIKIIIIGVVYMIYKNKCNRENMNNILNSLQTNDKIGGIIKYIQEMYNIISMNINNEITNENLITDIMYKSITVCFDYINNDLIENSIKKMLEYIWNKK